MAKDNEFDGNPGFWHGLFHFGRLLLGMGEVTQEQWSGNYQDYIHSSAWGSKSKDAKERAGNRCQLCNSKENLQTHHRTYERLGDEEPGDLIVLCEKCHKKFHGVL